MRPPLFPFFSSPLPPLFYNRQRKRAQWFHCCCHLQLMKRSLSLSLSVCLSVCISLFFFFFFFSLSLFQVSYSSAKLQRKAGRLISPRPPPPAASSLLHSERPCAAWPISSLFSSRLLHTHTLPLSLCYSPRPSPALLLRLCPHLDVAGGDRSLGVRRELVDAVGQRLGA